MIDWHSHILPAMDDGSRNVEESVSLIKKEMEQGVSRVVLTPHFYANDESLELFLERRSKAYASLKGVLAEDSPEILLGAEVRYYRGISRMERLKDLRIEGSKLLLLEMPVARWTEIMIRELIEMSAVSGIKIILAHVERYLRLQKKEVWERLYRSGILMQVNAGFFNSLASRRKAISLLREGKIQLVGSDCHNLSSRPSQIGKAFDIIKNKIGDDFLRQMNEYGESMLENKKLSF